MEALSKNQEDPSFKIDEPFKAFSEKISNEIKKAIDKDQRLLIMASDIDNTGCAAIIYYL